MRYAVIVEAGKTSFGAYVPDLPGCVAVAETRDEVVRLIEEAIEISCRGPATGPSANPRAFFEYRVCESPRGVILNPACNLWSISASLSLSGVSKQNAAR